MFSSEQQKADLIEWLKKQPAYRVQDIGVIHISAKHFIVNIKQPFILIRVDSRILSQPIPFSFCIFEYSYSNQRFAIEDSSMVLKYTPIQPFQDIIRAFKNTRRMVKRAYGFSFFDQQGNQVLTINKNLKLLQKRADTKMKKEINRIQSINRERESNIEQLKGILEKNQNDNCSICEVPITVEQSLRIIILPCQHIFHVLCIGNWFKVKRNCPLCRSDCTELDWPY